MSVYPLPGSEKMAAPLRAIPRSQEKFLYRQLATVKDPFRVGKVPED